MEAHNIRSLTPEQRKKHFNRSAVTFRNYIRSHPKNARSTFKSKNFKRYRNDFARMLKLYVDGVEPPVNYRNDPAEEAKENAAAPPASNAPVANLLNINPTLSRPAAPAVPNNWVRFEGGYRKSRKMRKSRKSSR